MHASKVSVGGGMQREPDDVNGEPAVAAHAYRMLSLPS
jgi:hypothetical protein